MSKLSIIIIIIYLLLFPSFASEQYHSYGGLSLAEKPVLSEIGAKRWALETGLLKEDSLMSRIVFCESSWNPDVCNNHIECKKGMGLCGIISGTWNKTIVEMSQNDIYLPERCWQFVYLPVSQERTEPIFDGECNLLVGLYLLETKGTAPWGFEGASWGSWKCFKEYI